MKSSFGKKPSMLKTAAWVFARYGITFAAGYGLAIHMVWTGKFDEYRQSIQNVTKQVQNETDKALSPLAAARLRPPVGATLAEPPPQVADNKKESGDKTSATPIAKTDGDAPKVVWNIPFWIDASSAPSKIGKDESIKLVKQAAAAWAACGANFQYSGERSKNKYGHYGPGETQDTNEPIVSWMSLSDTTAGTTWRSETAGEHGGQVVGWTMELDPKHTSTPELMVAVTTHEFGHAFGMDHARDKASIMYGIADPKVTTPNKDDIAECRRILEGWKKNVAESSGMAKKG